MLLREEEEQLIVRSQQGDIQAFNQLVLSFQQQVYTTAYRLLGNVETAADITQDTFFAAYRHIKTFRGGASFKSWVLRIATNLATDHWRRQRRRPGESLEALVEDEESIPSHQQVLLTSTEESEHPEASLLNKELQQVIQQEIDRLPFDQRVALILCDVQGLSYDEIATATGATPGTVRSRISRARARLREYLSAHRELLPGNHRHNHT